MLDISSVHVLETFLLGTLVGLLEGVRGGLRGRRQGNNLRFVGGPRDRRYPLISLVRSALEHLPRSYTGLSAVWVISHRAAR